VEKRNEKVISIDFKIGEEVVIKDVKAIVSQKLKRKLENGDIPIKKKEKRGDKDKLTYADLGIDPPETFDYEHYTYDWCRYCGARYSSNFTKGPWGSRTLCTIHYIDWNQKKVLNLQSHKDLPIKPIKPECNTELSYLQKMLSKNDKEVTPEMLESLKPTKKIRRADTEAINENSPEDAKIEMKDEEDLNGVGTDGQENHHVPVVDDNDMKEESN